MYQLFTDQAFGVMFKISLTKAQGQRERERDDTVLDLKMEEGVMSQGTL